MRTPGRILALLMLSAPLWSAPAEAGPRRWGHRSAKKKGTWRPDRVVVYVRGDCELCDRLEMLLKGWNVAYSVRNLTLHPEESPALHRECMARHVSCRGYPLADVDGKLLQTGPEMFEFLKRLNPTYYKEPWWEPLAKASEGDGNSQERQRSSDYSYSDTGGVSSR